MANEEKTRTEPDPVKKLCEINKNIPEDEKRFLQEVHGVESGDEGSIRGFVGKHSYVVWFYSSKAKRYIEIIIKKEYITEK